MAAQPVSERELAALHQRIARDVATLRRRWSPRAERRHRAPGDLVVLVVELFRVMQAAQTLVASLRLPASPAAPRDSGIRRRT